MSNDLLFSVIPRNNRVEVKSNSVVARIKKEGRSDRINEEDHEKQKEEQRADQEAVQKRHGKVVQSDDKEQTSSKQDDSDGHHLDVYV